jgi:uncharacterized membrane protein YhaH (DUF805 family)
MEPVVEEVAWYWTVFGVVVFAAILYLAVRRIRDKGRGRLAEWVREKWPEKG